jgi:glutathione S-transferase
VNTSEHNCVTLRCRSGTVGYLMGDRFTSADILLTTCLVWAIEYGVGVCDNALPYLARVTSRRAYTKSAGVNAAAI